MQIALLNISLMATPVPLGSPGSLLTPYFSFASLVGFCGFGVLSACVALSSKLVVPRGFTPTPPLP